MAGGSSQDALKAMKDIARFIEEASGSMDPGEVDRFIDLLAGVYGNPSRKVLVMGAGRSGLVGRAFAMRLLHLGYNSYVLGETIVPSVKEGDVVIAISGSGKTRLIIAAAEVAKQVGAIVVSITTYPDSPLGQISDLVVRVPGRTKMSKPDDYYARQLLGLHEPLAPLGTLFEDTALVFLDGVTYALMKRLNVSEEDMRSRHANVEL